MTTKILVVLCCRSACKIQTVSFATSESPEKSGIFSSHALQCWITVLLLRKTGPERCLFLSNHHHQTGDELLMNSGQIQKVFALALNEVNDRKLPDSHRSAVCSFGPSARSPTFSTFNFVGIKKQTSCRPGKTTGSTCHVWQRWKSVCDFVAQSGNSSSTRRCRQKMRGRQREKKK